MLLQGIQPTKTPLKIWVRSHGQIKSYGPFQLVHWPRRWYAPTDIVAWSSDSMLLHGKQPIETPLNIYVRSHGRIKSYKPL